MFGACNHAFHMHCIMKWIKSPTNSREQCPMCRRPWRFKGDVSLEQNSESKQDNEEIDTGASGGGGVSMSIDVSNGSVRSIDLDVSDVINSLRDDN